MADKKTKPKTKKEKSQIKDIYNSFSSMALDTLKG